MVRRGSLRASVLMGPSVSPRKLTGGEVSLNNVWNSISHRLPPSEGRAVARASENAPCGKHEEHIPYKSTQGGLVRSSSAPEAFLASCTDHEASEIPASRSEGYHRTLKEMWESDASLAEVVKDHIRRDVLLWGDACGKSRTALYKQHSLDAILEDLEPIFPQAAANSGRLVEDPQPESSTIAGHTEPLPGKGVAVEEDECSQGWAEKPGEGRAVHVCAVLAELLRGLHSLVGI